MTGVKRAIRAGLDRALGPVRAQRAIHRYLDVRSAVTYRASSSGRRSARNLRSLKDAHRGKRCFIIGNGPSLKGMDLSPLRGEVTFGLNRIYLLFDRLGFRTSFLVTVNELVVAQYCVVLRFALPLRMRSECSSVKAAVQPGAYQPEVALSNAFYDVLIDVEGREVELT